MSILNLIDKANVALFNHAKVDGDYTLTTDALNVELTSVIEDIRNGKTNCHQFSIELDAGNNMEFKFAFWELAPESYTFTLLDWRLNIDGMGYKAYYGKIRSVEDLGNRELELEIFGKMDTFVARLQQIV